MPNEVKGVKGILHHKLIFIICALLFIASSITATYLYFVNQRDKNDEIREVLTVNSQLVSVKEFKAKMTENQSNIYIYFHNKYNAEQTANFWTTSMGGEVPLDKLKDKTLSDIVRIKVEQILAKEKGVIGDIRYSAFIKKLNEENKRRQDDLTNNKIVYGPVSLMEYSYFKTVHEKMVRDVKGILAKDEFFLPDDQLIKQYEEDKDEFYKYEDTIRVKKMSFSFIDKSGNMMDENKKKEAKAVAGNVKELLDNGANFEEIVNKYDNNTPVIINVGEQVFNSVNSDAGDETYWTLHKEASKLSKGQISGVIEAEKEYVVFICTERTVIGYRPFEQEKDMVIARYVNQKYDELIEQRVKKAKIDIKRKVCDNLTVEKSY